MSIEESDVRNTIAEVLIEATSWRLRECIRIRELTATHRLGRMRLEARGRLRPHRHSSRNGCTAFSFRILRTFLQQTVQSEVVPYSREHTLEMGVDVERLKGWKLSFRSLRRRRNVIRLRDGYPRSIRGRRNPERRDGRPRSVRGQMNPEYRELRLSQQRVYCRLAGNNERRLRLSKTSNSTLMSDGGTITFLSRGMSCRVYCLLVFLLLYFFCLLSEKQVREARIIFTQGCESD